MTRVKTVREYVTRKLMEGDMETALKAVDHLNGAAMAAAYLAKRRTEDAELAAIAGLLHDMYAYTAGTYEDHAHKGADLARKILGKLKITSEEETDIICSAIYHHDDKASVDSPMDEVLKDADVIHHTMNDPQKPVKEKERKRYDALRAEFGLPPAAETVQE